MSAYTYAQDQELPAFQVEWRDGNGDVIDLSAATFTVKLVNRSTGATALTKTVGITGAAVSPNVTVAWTASELNLTPGVYQLYLYARSGSLDRVFSPADPPVIKIIAAPT